jgi:hypothetical protein
MKGYIDQPQIDYFSHAATHGMAPESKLILCVGEPVWANAVSGRIDDRYRSFIYLERLAGAARGPRSGAAMGHRFKLVLTGDSHHYSRFLRTVHRRTATMSPAAARPRAPRITRHAYDPQRVSAAGDIASIGVAQPGLSRSEPTAHAAACRHLPVAELDPSLQRRQDGRRFREPSSARRRPRSSTPMVDWFSSRRRRLRCSGFCFSPPGRWRMRRTSRCCGCCLGPVISRRSASRCRL